MKSPQRQQYLESMSAAIGQLCQHPPVVSPEQVTEMNACLDSYKAAGLARQDHLRQSVLLVTCACLALGLVVGLGATVAAALGMFDAPTAFLDVVFIAGATLALAWPYDRLSKLQAAAFEAGAAHSSLQKLLAPCPRALRTHSARLAKSKRAAQDYYHLVACPEGNLRYFQYLTLEKLVPTDAKPNCRPVLVDTLISAISISLAVGLCAAVMYSLGVFR